ncbi:MAG TPA: YdbC family protein [Atopostipes sp.]|nr:YdbC family protein [Atopostipes sp.]
MADFKYEIVQELGVISTNASGWTRELNLISWNDRPAKFDIRDWSPDHEKMGKGLTLSDEDIMSLKEILKDLEM